VIGDVISFGVIPFVNDNNARRCLNYDSEPEKEPCNKHYYKDEISSKYFEYLIFLELKTNCVGKKGCTIVNSESLNLTVSYDDKCLEKESLVFA